MGVDPLCVRRKDLRQANEVDQGEREETQVDSLPEALPEEHGHVDAVGGEADEEEGGDDDGGLESVEEALSLHADKVVGVVPRDGCVQAQDDAAVWNTAHGLADVINYGWWERCCRLCQTGFLLQDCC